jgi:hypothetical protein
MPKVRVKILAVGIVFLLLGAGVIVIGISEMQNASYSVSGFGYTGTVASSQFQTGEIITAFGGVFALIGLIATVYGAASHKVVAAYEPKGMKEVSSYQQPERFTQSTFSAGQPQNGVRYCPNCGAEVPREHSFCYACGQKQ